MFMACSPGTCASTNAHAASKPYHGLISWLACRVHAQGGPHTHSLPLATQLSACLVCAAVLPGGASTSVQPAFTCTQVGIERLAGCAVLCTVPCSPTPGSAFRSCWGHQPSAVHDVLLAGFGVWCRIDGNLPLVVRALTIFADMCCVASCRVVSCCAVLCCMSCMAVWCPQAASY